MATLAIQNATKLGFEPTFAAVAAGGDEFVNDGKTLLEFVNSSGANAYTITVATPATIEGLAVADVAVSMQAGVGERRVVGPFPINAFNDANGKVQITYTGTAPATDLTVAVIRLP